MFSGSPGDVAEAGRRDRHRLRRQHVVHDRQVVHGQVPEHVDVVLEQPEVHADRVVVVDVAELAVVDELAHLADRAGVDERVIDHEHQAAARRLRRSAAAPARRSAVIGFSTNTCLPACSACSARSKWLDTGVAIATASTRGSFSTSSKSSVISTAG